MVVRKYMTWSPTTAVPTVRPLMPHFAVTFARGLALVHHQIAGNACSKRSPDERSDIREPRTSLRSCGLLVTRWLLVSAKERRKVAMACAAAMMALASIRSGDRARQANRSGRNAQSPQQSPQCRPGRVRQEAPHLRQHCRPARNTADPKTRRHLMVATRFHHDFCSVLQSG
jgi:hypothetical protein